MNCSFFRAVKQRYVIALIKYCNHHGYQYVFEDSFGIVMPWTKVERRLQERIRLVDAQLCDLIREVRQHPEPILMEGGTPEPSQEVLCT